VDNSNAEGCVAPCPVIFHRCFLFLVGSGNKSAISLVPVPAPLPDALTILDMG